MKTVLAAYILFISLTQAYVITKTGGGEDVKWMRSKKSFNLTVSSSRSGTNSSSLSDAEINQIIGNSISEWNDASDFTIYPSYIQTQPVLGTGQTISFTTNSAYFGSGTLAITSLGFSPGSGEIVSGDILVNESLYNTVTLTDNPSQSSGSLAYLGDVITHELGHLLGLSHSEAPGSTMTYAVMKGMYGLHSDDINGIKKLYGPSEGGTIYGRIVGGSQVGVFGVNVNLISHTTGELVANVISEIDGSFTFSNLDEDKYVIWTTPLKSRLNLPQYYLTANTEYCSGSYQSSFFTKCGGRNRGRPQVIDLESSESIEVGEITIRCQGVHNPEYLKAKIDGYDEPFALREQGDNSNPGQTLHGIFFKDQVENGTAEPDQFEIDLTDIDASSGDLYLDMKLIVESLGSAVELEVSVQRSDESFATTFNVDQELLTGKMELSYPVRRPLSPTSSSNIFTVIVTPTALSVADTIAVFGNNTDLIASQHDYAILQGVSQGVGDSFNLVGTKEGSYPESNYYCTEGKVSRQTEAYLTSSGVGIKKNNDIEANPVTCATIDIDPSDGPPTGGLMSFCLGLLFLLMFNIPRHKFLS